MARILALTKRFAKEDSGQDLIEYALVAGLIGLAAVTTMSHVGTTISSGFSTIGSDLTSAL